MPHNQTTTKKQPHAKLPPFHWRNHLRAILFSAFGMVCFTLSSATVLAENATDSAMLPLTVPQRGESMTSVRARLGAPLEKLSAVGIPPIVRWVYKDFTVYFEYEHVIHSTPNSLKPTHRP